jgi:hypothetical protein
MRLLLFTIPPTLVLGLLFGGHLSNLAETSFRWPLAGLAGIALQFLPVGGTAGTLILTLSFVCLFIAVGVNWRLPGFVLVLVGLWLNFVVITVNQGMPVAKHAIVASGQAETLAGLRALQNPKHHLATKDDQLLFLADVVPIGPPVRQAVSVGDIVAYTGAMWFIVASMRRRSPVPSGDEGIATDRGAGTAPAPADVKIAEAS